MRGIRILAAAAFALAIIGGGGYYAYHLFIENQFRSALDQAVRELPPGYSAQYKTVSYSALSGQGSVEGLTVHKDAPQGFDLAIDRIEVDKPDFDFAAAWSKAAQDPAAVSPELALAVAGRINAKGVTLHADLLSGSLGSLELTGLHLYPWPLLQPNPPNLADIIALLQQRRQQPANLQELQPLLRSMAAFGLALGYDHFTEENLALTAKMAMPQDAAPVEVNEKIDRATSTHFERGLIGEGTLDGYAIKSGQGVDVQVAHAAVSGVDLRKPFTALLTQATLTPDFLDGLAIDRLAYEGMTVARPGKPPFGIGSITLAKALFAGGVLVSAEFGVSGISLSRAELPMPQADDAFTRLGLDRVSLSAALAYHWDAAQKRLAVPDFTLKLDELGTFDLSLDVDNVAPGIAAALQAQLGHAVLHYNDNSLAARVFRAGAAATQSDPPAYRQHLVTLIEEQAAGFPDDATLQAAAQAAIAFLREPKSLKIELAPPHPVPVVLLLRAAALTPPQLAALLGLSVEANQ